MDKIVLLHDTCSNIYIVPLEQKTKNKKHKTQHNTTKHNKTQQNTTKQNKTKQKRLHFYFVIQLGTFDLAISSILKSLWERSSLCWFKSNNFLNILWFNIFSLKLFQWVIFFSFPISCYLHVHNPNKYITKIIIISSSAPSVSQITHKGHENNENHHQLKETLNCKIILKKCIENSMETVHTYVRL